jgi:HPt (histidine-containing phosphotransfer) domain-containing protein
VSWLNNVLAGDSEIKSELQELARKAKDETIPAKERLVAMMELGSAVQAGEQLQAAINELEEAVDDEPKYVWRNGAKVKVK